VASENGHLPVVEALLQYGASVDHKNNVRMKQPIDLDELMKCIHELFSLGQ
jgi:hypothetical protein